jgi:site-specific DNA-methyltransferase (cytosine-N4-specific)
VEVKSLKDDPKNLHEKLARHVLLNLGGMALVQCIRDMTVAGELVDLTTLRKALAERGVHFPSGGKHPSMMPNNSPLPSNGGCSRPDAKPRQKMLNLK